MQRALQGVCTTYVLLWHCAIPLANEFRGTDELLEETASTWVAPGEPFIYLNRVLDLPSVIKLMKRSTHTQSPLVQDKKDIRLKRKGESEKAASA